MARRSARLQKRSPSPATSTASTSSWETAKSEPTPQPERLPSVFEGQEPTMQTPQKSAAAKAHPASQLPQLSGTTPTQLKTKSSVSSMLTAFAARTPKNRTPIKPAGEEMHPQHHHATTAKVLDEARHLGFQAMGAHTAPQPKGPRALISQTTPSRTPVPASSTKVSSLLPTPDFRFRFKSPISGVSPQTDRLAQESEAGNYIAGGRTLFGADEFSIAADLSPKRKMAVPKGKSGRFSDAHKTQFDKMDSIANHASAFRADPNRFKVVGASLKRSPSKAELDKAESNAKTPITPAKKSLKRTQSKMDMTTTPKIVPPSLKHTSSDMNMASGSRLPRTQSTVRLVPPSRDGRPQTQESIKSPAKRLKRNETDDAASTRPAPEDEQHAAKIATPTPARKLHSQASLPRLASRLMTPTKSSLMRSQSARALKTTSTSMIPSLLRSPSAKNLFSPTNMAETVKEGIRKTSDSLNRVKSILRTPSRKFSADPEKIAAGTHMSPPMSFMPKLDKALPKIPSTAPVRKHVNFTTSTLERDEVGPNHSPSPVKGRAGSEVPTGAIVFPRLGGAVEYPTLPEESPMGSPSRRLTFGGTGADVPGQFSFQSASSVKFGPATVGTIRMVRKSDASSLVDGKKRKLDSVEESSDKENTEPRDEGRSPAKKMKTSVVEPPKTPTSRLPQRTPKRGGFISKSRLAFLATPRRSKA
ncbi:hypothetical protein EJ04DRAFT_560400 [Polyplosphaeria fusca]|uniref:Uncharacterized protein n=1 Tax=Polyplosphaeria fusca TaxID=682080 RepID=A0A9P4R963_9PLEO|nr:hypothetical protein EJ04DRAFT_560400 [Polyplosphaeria fusca]